MKERRAARWTPGLFAQGRRDPERCGGAARAKREKAAIHWSGETGVRDQDQIGPLGKS
jgi:hypothetical protein